MSIWLRFTAVVALLLAVTHPALAQTSICVREDGKCAAADLRTGSAAFGYGSASITSLGGVPDRVMTGVALHYDLHLLSLILRGLPIRTYDAVYADVIYGRMTSTPLKDNIGDEDTSAFPWTLGYHFLVGKDFSGFSLLGGVGYQEFTYSIGGSMLDGKAHPLIARAEVGSRRRLVLTGMKGGGDNELTLARVDLPFWRGFNVTAQYSATSGKVDLFNNAPRNAKTRAVMLGLRTAEIR
jgi:hypothetical protein